MINNTIKKYNWKRIYIFWFCGNSVNHQFTNKKQFFIFKIYSSIIGFRLYRLQICVDVGKNM